MLTMTLPTSTPAMRSAASMARRAACSAACEIDDRAALDAVRALMADAEHLAAMGAAAQRRRRLHRRQPRDQADDLRRADVEHRQDRALARRDLAHARRERPEGHCCASFFLGACASAQASADFLRQAHEHPAGSAEVEGQHVAFQDALLALQPQQRRRSRACGSSSGSLMSIPDLSLRFQRRWSTRTPGLDAGLSSSIASRRAANSRRAQVRALADDERQPGVAVVAQRRRSRAPSARDRLDLAVLLPERVGRALDDLDDDLVGIELAHARLLDERVGLEPGLARAATSKKGSEFFGADAGDARGCAARSCATRRRR